MDGMHDVFAELNVSDHRALTNGYLSMHWPVELASQPANTVFAAGGDHQYVGRHILCTLQISSHTAYYSLLELVALRAAGPEQGGVPAITFHGPARHCH